MAIINILSHITKHQFGTNVKGKGSIRRDEPQFIAEQEDEKQKDEKYILYRNKFVNSGMIYRMTNIIGDIIIETMEEIER